LQIEPKTLKIMRLVLSSLFALGLFSNTVFAAPERATLPDIRDSGFVYCVSGQVDTFNPQKAGSGLIVDTLAAQLYDRLLDVDPILTAWCRNWPKAGKCLITARPTASICATMSLSSARALVYANTQTERG
jgi:hypothetical protein